MSNRSLTREQVLQTLHRLAPELRARGVSRVDLIGSVARDQARSESDVDLLVELSRPLGFAFFALEVFLAEELGAPVELSTRAAMRSRVLKAAEQDIVPVF